MSKTIPWIVAAAVSVLLAPAAHAVPTLSMQLTSGATNVLLTDSAHTGLISYNNTLGNFTINVVTGTGVGSLSPGAGGDIDLNSINVTAGASGVLTLALTETGLTGSPGLASFFSAIGGTVGSLGQLASSLTFDTYVDASNTAFGTASHVFSDTFSGTGNSFSNDGFGVGTASGLYSETIIVTLTAAANSKTSLDASLTPAPEPASMSILGAGILGLGMLQRHRNKKSR